MVYSPTANLVMFTGSEILVHRGSARTTSILPTGVARNVKKLHKINVYEKAVELVKVEFTNGRFACLFLHLQCLDPIDDEDLKEFRATCLMLHDL